MGDKQPILTKSHPVPAAVSVLGLTPLLQVQPGAPRASLGAQVGERTQSPLQVCFGLVVALEQRAHTQAADSEAEGLPH